jgi:nucleoside-triphosphatase
MKKFLLTGPPACGKTPVGRLIGRLIDIRLSGFYTRELREGGTRVGFEAVGLSTRPHALRTPVRSRPNFHVGRYRVEVLALAQVVEPELVQPAAKVDLFVVDEIATMELLCEEFAKAVRRLSDGTVPVVATLATKGGGLIAEVKGRDRVRLVEVTEGNSESLGRATGPPGPFNVPGSRPSPVPRS